MSESGQLKDNDYIYRNLAYAYIIRKNNNIIAFSCLKNNIRKRLPSWLNIRDYDYELGYSWAHIDTAGLGIYYRVVSKIMDDCKTSNFSCWTASLKYTRGRERMWGGHKKWFDKQIGEDDRIVYWALEKK